MAHSREEILEQVKGALSEKLGIEESEITEEASFEEDLGADSLDLVEVVMDLEDQFGDVGVARHVGGLVRAAWPALDAEAAREDSVELAVQVNGKVRGHVVVPREAPEDAIRARALAEPRVAEHVQGKQMVRFVVVPGRLVSVVVK